MHGILNILVHFVVCMDYFIYICFQIEHNQGKSQLKK
jgi:hypothetical protein